MGFLNGSDSENNLETKGYEDYYIKDGITDQEIEADKEKFSRGTTPTGRNLPAGIDSVESLTYDQFSQIVFGDDNQVFGMPYKYTPLADPLMKTYENTFENDANIVYITFGTAKINRSLYRKLDVENDSSNAAIFAGFSNVIPSMFSGSDPRLVQFKADFHTFYKSASTTANYLWFMLDLPGGFDWDENFKGFDSAGVPFYCTKNTSVSEGLSNEYRESNITSKANQDAQEQRENYQLTGTYGGVGADEDWLDTIGKKMVETAKNIVSDLPIIGGIASIFMKTNKGSMQFYGDLWYDSKVECSYSLNFKFTTPYGNKLDIYRNVYFPFALLWTAAQPRQDGKYAYKEPFLVKCQFPGWFVIECGVIESINWIKGGDNQLWSAEGLPLEMNVTMTVRDLYPVSMSSSTLSNLKYNRGLLAYLENMAGMTTTQLSAKAFEKKIKAMAGQVKQSVTNFVSLRTFRNWTGDVWSNLGNKFNTGL